MERKLIIVLALTMGLGLAATNAFSQPNFQPPTTGRYYVGCYGEDRGAGSRHWNLDIVGERPWLNLGDIVVASADGIVRKADYDRKSGNYVIIDHGGGWRTTYSHLHDSFVSNGQSVTSGQYIGSVGATGNARGPHLDFGIRHYDQALNPLDLLWPEKYEWRGTKGCTEEDSSRPPHDSRPAPGGDHPDDTYSVAESTFTIGGYDLTDTYYRLAGKKGKIIILNYYQLTKLLQERSSYFENLPESTPPDQNYLDGLETKIANLYESFGTNQELFWKEYEVLPDVAVLNNGFSESMSDLLNKKLEPTSDIAVDFSLDELKEQPILFIPSGGLYGLENSDILKASLDEYVKNGGTLIVFAQQHGYEFSALPVPQEEDGTYKTITGYGWTEDQSCFTDAAYIDTWHQILAGQIKSTPSLHVDGYFTTYPSNARILLRRTANGQPALLIYEYGEGKVILTSMYSDFAFAHNQASSEEITLVRDMVAWAKKPAQLPEIGRGETVSVEVLIINKSTSDASSAKVVIYNPDRSSVVAEQALNLFVPAGQTVTIPISYSPSLTSPLGIYHIDYVLLDSQGAIIQPQAETDSGRFAVSNPPKSPAQTSQLTFSIQTDGEHYIFGSMVTFQIVAFNNSDVERIVTAKYDGITRDLVVPAKGSSSFTHSREIRYANDHYGHLWEALLVYFYEGNRSLGVSSKVYWVYWPSAQIAVKTDKNLYEKGKSVTITASLKNNITVSWQPAVSITVRDSRNSTVFEDKKTLSLPPEGTGSIVFSFNLSQGLSVGSYTVQAVAQSELYLGSSSASVDYAGFELPQSQITVTPDLPSVYSPGTNFIPFTVTNTGKINVSSGTLDISVKDPDSGEVFSGSNPFSLAVGEVKTLNIPISIPSVGLGNYVFTYSQSDETRRGNPTEITISSKASVSSSWDKLSYRVRETANLTVGLVNMGKFVLDNLSVKVSMPEANYTETKTVSLGLNPNTASVNFLMPIPDTFLADFYSGEVTVASSSGRNLTERIWFRIQESELVIEYSGPATVGVGEVMNLQVENTGGMDTSYVTEEISVDSKGLKIFSGNVTGTVLSGEKKSLINIQIPSQAVNGTALLRTLVKDNTTGRIFSYYKSFEIRGLTASVQAETDKETYFKTEAVTGTSTLANGSFGIEQGSLKILVNRVKSTPHFLPKQGWVGFRFPSGIALGMDGSLYVVERDNHRVQKFGPNGNFITKWGSKGSENGQLYSPQSIATGLDGSIYVADTYNHRIQKFDSNGKFVSKWGIEGSGDGEFRYPNGIAMGPDGTIYVADSGNHRIQKFDSNGTFAMKWGATGRGSGQFMTMVGVAIGSEGSIYVMDRYYYVEDQVSRIQKFDNSGNFILQWYPGFWNYASGIAAGPGSFIYVTDDGFIKKYDSNGNFITQFGGEDQIGSPYGIVVGQDGIIYVSDIGKREIRRLDADGNLITRWGASGTEDGKFYSPSDIAIGPDGSVYVVDWGNYRIQRFDRDGNFVLKWGSRGEGDGQFFSPNGIAVDSVGHVYVADGCDDYECNNRIQKFDGNGNFVTKWGSYGRGDGQFYSPVGVAVGPDGSIYVSDSCGFLYCNHRIQKFGPDGTFVSKWGFEGSGDGEFFYPGGIAIGPDGSIYVADSGNARIQKFDPDGAFLSKWGGAGSDDGQFLFPLDIAVETNGSVYVADTYNNRIQKFDSNGTFKLKWGSEGSEDGQCDEPSGLAIGPDGYVYIADTGNHRIQRYIAETLFETSLPITQAANTSQDYMTNIGTLNAIGKLYLQATLLNSLGQIIGSSNHPFYIIEGNTALLINTDKEVYRPGEIVSVTGRVENHAPIEAQNLVLSLSAKLNSQASQILHTETFNVPADGSYAFTATRTADAEGRITLTGNVSQNNAILVEIMDQYEVAKPAVTVSITSPDVVGNEPFSINLEMKNTGKVEATIQFGVQSLEFVDTQTVNILPGEAKLLQYTQQITKDTLYTFTFSGDLEQTVNKTVAYGLSATIAMNPEPLHPEGNVAVPVTITNTGQLAETLEVNFELNPGGTIQTKTCSLPAGGSVNDILYFNLAEGDYQLIASSELPTASAQASFSVKNENKAEISVSLGTQTDGLIPVNVNVSNSGYNSIDGSIRFTVSNSLNEAVWNGEEVISQISPLGYQLLTLNINPSAIQPGNYTLKVELLNNTGQLLASRSSSLTIQGPIFQITQIPPYQVFSLGQEATFVFRIKNTGNQEGTCDFNFAAYDVISSTQREWFKPGEEKPISFSFMLPEDLEEKDYFATYELKNQGPGIKGQVKYHLAGINLNVNASLDKQNYREGERAHLTLSVSPRNSQPSTLGLFARVNYNGYEDQQPFTLNGGQTIPFDIPLTQITGEKLFYGIYHESGRSIHLNSLYIHKAGDEISLTTDKQVYNPNEAVSVTVKSVSGITGTMTLTAPNYTDTFPFSGIATKSFVLPSTMTAGTYFINGQLEATNPGTINISHPIDVAGIQVKVLECNNDKGKYAPTDSIATNLTISSNTTVGATLKTWIVDPKGQFNLAGEKNIDLSSSENLLVTQNSSLTTGISGIHRLTYGVYLGDLLLVSGSEAFDVGDAVLLGIATDKTDYPTPNETVTVKARLYGSVPATLEYFLDGQSVASSPVSLSGVNTIQYPLTNIPPGRHILKAILTSGGLTSEKETTFIYGSSLPDLTVQLYRDQAIESSAMKITLTAINQGKTGSGATTVHLYDGLTNSGKILTALNVESLVPGGSQSFTYALDCLGRAGANTISAFIDSANTVFEFNEANNEANMSFSIPDLTLATNLEKDVYSIGDTVLIAGLISNLSKDSISGIVLSTNVRDASGVEIFANSQSISPMAAMSNVKIDISWPTSPDLPEGIYTIRQVIEGKDLRTEEVISLKLDKDFSVVADHASLRIETGETAQYNLTLTPIRGFTGEISLSIKDCPQGFTASFTPNPVLLSEGLAQALLKMIPTAEVKSGSYSMTLTATGGGRSRDLALSLELTDFGMTVTPATQTIQQLGEASYTISLDSINGFDSQVTLEVDGVPRSMKANLSSNQVTLPKDVTLTLDTSKWVLPGSYDISILAKGRVINHETTGTLVVHKNPAIALGIITAPGASNEPTIDAFSPGGDLLSHFQPFDAKSGLSISAGDVDGDGVDEVVVATSWKLQKTPALLGIFNRDGTKVALTETEYRSRYGLTLAVGDMDGDWVEDIAMGYYESARNDDDEDDFEGWDKLEFAFPHAARGHGGVKIYQFMGQKFIDTGLVLYPYENERYRGAPNLAIADVDGDGVPELITVPGPDPCAPAKIKVYKIDTKEGVGRWKITSQMAEFIVTFDEKKRGFGGNIAAGDIDGDGSAELIIGAGPDPRNPSTVKVYRGDGTFTGIEFKAFPDISHKQNKDQLNRFGVFVTVGDVEMDGIFEIITGMGPGPQNEGWVRIFRGDGTPFGNGFLAYPEEMKFGVRVSSGNIGE